MTNQNKPVDRRIARTELAIRDAFVALINEKGFDALTVRDIVDRADINRGTFYLHYKDKYDLLEQTFTDIAGDIQEIFVSAIARHGGAANGTDHLQRLVLLALEYVKGNAAMMQAILALQGEYSFVARVRRMMERNVKLGTLPGLKPENFLVPREYLLSYILSAHLGVLQSWLAAGCKESPQEMAQILFRLSFEGPLRVAGLGVAKPARAGS